MRDVKLLGTRKAADALGVNCNTLRAWANRSHIDFQLTPGGHRRFDITSVRQADTPADHSTNLRYATNNTLPSNTDTGTQKKEKGAIYCRVSSRKQKDDLERQIKTMQAHFPHYKIYKDIASGLNYKRKGLTRLLEHIQEGLVDKVVVAHRDRLARFGVELVEWIINRGGATLVFLDQTDKNKRGSSEELAEDLLAVVHVFSCRLNGKRRYKNTQQGGDIEALSDLQASDKKGETTEKDRTGCASTTESDKMSFIANVSNAAPACLVAALDDGHTENVQSSSRSCAGKKPAYAGQGQTKPRRPRANTTTHTGNKRRRLPAAPTPS
jgi:putative resolvase